MKKRKWGKVPKGDLVNTSLELSLEDVIELYYQHGDESAVRFLKANGVHPRKQVD